MPALRDPTRPSVLVVEDEALIRLDLARELIASGFEVVEASQGSEAVARFRENGNIDAAVVDIGLPGGMTGYCVVRAMREIRPSCTIILASASDLKMPPDFDEHVLVETKPYDPAKIAHILRMRHAENL